MSERFQKMLHASNILQGIPRLEGNRVDSDEVAHYEPPHLDLLCWQL